MNEFIISNPQIALQKNYTIKTEKIFFSLIENPPRLSENHLA